MKRTDINPLPEYFDRYILLNDESNTLSQSMNQCIKDIENVPLKHWKAIGHQVYAPGKWTLHEIVQHIMDTERIFSYRALAFARGDEQQLPGFDENMYTANSFANRRSIEDLIVELILCHQSTQALFESFTTEMLTKKGMGFKGVYTVGAIGFIITGHQNWHLNIVKERYLGLV